MQALVLTGYNRISYEKAEDPVIGDEDVLISVMACGICGSDVHGLDGSTCRRIPPLIMGHEASGVIVATGNKVKGWKPGDHTLLSTSESPASAGGMQTSRKPDM